MNKELSHNKVVAIEKLSDKDLMFEYYNSCDNSAKFPDEELRDELYKRLSSKSVEEYKKRLVEEIKRGCGGDSLVGIGIDVFNEKCGTDGRICYDCEKILQRINNLK